MDAQASQITNCPYPSPRAEYTVKNPSQVRPPLKTKMARRGETTQPETPGGRKIVTTRNLGKIEKEPPKGLIRRSAVRLRHSHFETMCQLVTDALRLDYNCHRNTLL